MDDLKKNSKPEAIKPTSKELVSAEECKRYLNRFNLSDKQVLDIKNSLTGIVNSIINSYLDEFY